MSPSDPQTLPDRPVQTRTAVFGGTFDPIHNGHLFMAGEVLRLKLASEVLFVPSGNPPHKVDSLATDADRRLAMVSAAIEAIGEFSVSDIEITRTEGTSYTFDTMTLLQRVFPDRNLVFCLGMDSLNELHTWHRATELVAHFEILTYPRGGCAPPAFTRLADRFGAHHAARLLNAVIDCETAPISSSAIRQHVAQSRTLAGLVPSSVIEYIRRHRLYRPAPQSVPENAPEEPRPSEASPPSGG